MRVLITGGTGFVGRAVVPVLQREGHSVLVWTRDPTRARGRLGADVETVDAALGQSALAPAVERSDAVVNLAGAPLLRRWTPRGRRVLRQSRVEFTRLLVSAMAQNRHRPRVMVSASAVGYYGHRGDEILQEHSAGGNDFLAHLCHDWEAAGRSAEPLGLRVVRLRSGVVLGRDGGALASMLPVFRLGLGGAIASGKQYLPWIHLHDIARVVAAALVDDRLDGPVNAVAPAPVTSAEFARALGRAVRRPAVLRVPAIALRVLLGEAAEVVVASQRADPACLQDAGFSFLFPTLDSALADIMGGADVAIERMQREIESHGGDAGLRYLAARRPTFELRTATLVQAPLEQTFAFFSKAENLGVLTPASMRFSLDGPAPAIREGTTIRYRLRVGPVPIRWRSRIVSWSPGARFVDLQEKGPYRSWWHEHAFRAHGPSTLMEDRVCYAPPFGVLGRLANRLLIVPSLRRIFRYRADVIRLRFGASAPSALPPSDAALLR
jgi:uncharacterized protein (TIGR01777 family)